MIRRSEHAAKAIIAPARADSFLNELTKTSKIPGIQYLVVTSASVLFEHYSGLADIHRQIPIDHATTMMAYSMSKTITAAAVLQLVERGRVGLDDPVEQYLPSQPYGSSVTVRQLISHTSGIQNPLPLHWVHPAERHASFDENAALADVLRDHPRLSFNPGSRYAYSNIGYWLLGKIVEHSSGEIFSSYVANQIVQPLRIGPGDLGYIVTDPAHHATGYLEKYSLMNLVRGFLIDRQLVGDYRQVVGHPQSLRERARIWWASRDREGFRQVPSGPTSRSLCAVQPGNTATLVCAATNHAWSPYCDDPRLAH